MDRKELRTKPWEAALFRGPRKERMLGKNTQERARCWRKSRWRLGEESTSGSEWVTLLNVIGQVG